MKKERIGLCSNYLANLPLNSCVKLFAEPGSFRFPTDRPIIMVGKCCVNQPILTVYHKCFRVLGFCTPSQMRNTRLWTVANMPHASLQTCFITNMHHYKHASPLQIGPGTGCAPFRSLIQSRAKTSQQLILFYGCRSEHHDYFFRSEWDQITNLQVITAFSRDQERKIYVQHRIVEHGALVWGALEQGAVFCVAG